MTPYVEIGKPLHGGRSVRGCSVQFGLKPWFFFEAWLDTGYEDSWYEYTFSVGLWGWSMHVDWRPLR